MPQIPVKTERNAAYLKFVTHNSSQGGRVHVKHDFETLWASASLKKMNANFVRVYLDVFYAASLVFFLLFGRVSHKAT